MIPIFQNLKTGRITGQKNRARPTLGCLFALLGTIRGQGAMVDIGLGPTYGFSISSYSLRNNHLVVSRLMPTIAPAY